MGNRHTKNSQLTAEEKRLARMFKALGNPTRLWIIRYLKENPNCITNDIVAVVPLAQATISQHLKVLREAGLINGIVDGPATNYCIDDDSMGWLKEKMNLLL